MPRRELSWWEQVAKDWRDHLYVKDHHVDGYEWVRERVQRDGYVLIYWHPVPIYGDDL